MWRQPRQRDVASGAVGSGSMALARRRYILQRWGGWKYGQGQDDTPMPPVVRAGVFWMDCSLFWHPLRVSGLVLRLPAHPVPMRAWARRLSELPKGGALAAREVSSDSGAYKEGLQY